MAKVTSLREELLNANVDMFNTFYVQPSALASGLVPLDLDGYAPMMAYIGTEGFLANTELREGSQHCQCNTPEYLKLILSVIPYGPIWAGAVIIS